MGDGQHADNGNNEEDRANRWEGAAAAAARPMSVMTPIGTLHEGVRDDRSEVEEPQSTGEESEKTCGAFNKMLDELRQ
uniref:Uncharacterized protein n=1 Tax=Chromera velia CCMP2878 TaxID=1169474 RepID=A0A0G4G8X3_9ALVE|eukprot:Cvel_20763.t1-p1 / transcript=Cvel_20763.t1 / gene=Cvel_20763 / organism=Chromera_velia_CCMP2878 / gene_product=hypothetical protein / transcript_product=hypothetical protein / location=Cvel_scaffold1893:10084-10314(-) / protein_length=77 / sequence_SO=supercontig / SO=protein_coding / is_pseudo=false